MQHVSDEFQFNKGRYTLDTSPEHTTIDGLYPLSFCFIPGEEAQGRGPIYGAWTSLDWWWNSFPDPVKDAYHSSIKINCILNSAVLFMQECKDDMIP